MLFEVLFIHAMKYVKVSVLKKKKCYGQYVSLFNVSSENLTNHNLLGNTIRRSLLQDLL